MDPWMQLSLAAVLMFLLGVLVFYRFNPLRTTLVQAALAPCCLWLMTIPWHHTAPAWLPTQTPVLASVGDFWLLIWWLYGISSWLEDIPIVQRWLDESRSLRSAITPRSLSRRFLMLGFFYFSAVAAALVSPLLMGVGLGCMLLSTGPAKPPLSRGSRCYADFQAQRWAYILYTHGLLLLLWHGLVWDERMVVLLKPWMTYYMPLALAYTGARLLSPLSKIPTFLPNGHRARDALRKESCWSRILVCRTSIAWLSLGLCTMAYHWGERGGHYVLAVSVAIFWLGMTWAGWFGWTVFLRHPRPLSTWMRP